MKKLFYIIRFVIKDLLKSKWIIAYFLFYLITGIALSLLSDQLTKVMVTLLYLTLYLVPLVACLFSSMYLYQIKEFVTLLFTQPLHASYVSLGYYLGICFSLILCYLGGLGLPLLIFWYLDPTTLINLLLLLWSGILLTCIFTGISFYFTLSIENKIKGFGYVLISWLFFTILYDALFLILLIQFRDYPLENFALITMILNPIDLARILILLHMDMSALLGFTGASLKAFLGSNWGMAISQFFLILWLFLPLIGIRRVVSRKDF